MRFAKKLQKLMDDLGLNQTQVAKLTGIGHASISQYLSGLNEPRRMRRQEMAAALGVQPDYFEEFLPEPQISCDGQNLKVADVAKLMGKSTAWVAEGLKQGALPFGYAVKLKDWSYYISPKKFTEFTGIPVPVAATADAANNQ